MMILNSKMFGIIIFLSYLCTVEKIKKSFGGAFFMAHTIFDILKKRQLDARLILFDDWTIYNLIIAK